MAARKVFYALLVLTLSAAFVQASGYPASMTRESLIDNVSLSALSVGADFQVQERAIRPLGEPSIAAVAQVDWFSGFIGLDIAPCWTFFATAGGCSLEDTLSGAMEESGSRWSVGMDLNLLSHEVYDPYFMAGNLSVHVIVEAMSMDFDVSYDGSEGSLEWTEHSVAVPVTYEMVAKHPEEKDSVHSLMLYAGPLYSPVKVRVESGGSLMEEFKSERDLGVVAGVDIFLSSNLSIGVKTTYFDEASVGAVVRYHF